MSLKNFTLFLTIALIAFSGCNTTQKLINSGNYDQAIARSVNKLQRNKSKEKQVRLLKAAYDKAQERDLKEVAFLKKEGLAGNSVEVFRIYQNMENRQDKIRPLLPLYLEGAEVPFRLINVNDELIRWKKEAAGFLYSNASKLLEENNKFSARRAYYQFLEADEIYPGYMDVDKQIDRALRKGMNWVRYSITNRSPNLVPVEFVDELYNLDYLKLQGEWFRLLPADERHNISFDNEVHLVVEIVDVGPEKLNEREWTEKKEIESGSYFVKDDEGNFVKDSLGNKIKATKYKEIECDVKEIKQFKASTFKGRIEILDSRADQLLVSDPINVNFVFSHISLVTQGNEEALSEETAKKLRNKPVPFPSDFQMIMDATVEVKPIISNYLRRHDELLER